MMFYIYEAENNNFPPNFNVCHPQITLQDPTGCEPIYSRCVVIIIRSRKYLKKKEDYYYYKVRRRRHLSQPPFFSFFLFLFNLSFSLIEIEMN